MMITMFVSCLFPGDEPDCVLSDCRFGCLMLIWRISYKWLPFVLQILFVGLLTLYGVLIDSVCAFDIPYSLAEAAHENGPRLCA